jgi:oligoendopeptidase F
MKEKWLELSELYRGDSVEYYQEDGYYWAKVSHYYTPYYVYQYAADIAYAASIAQRITSGDKKALDDYIAFLKLGDSKSPTELLNVAGVDPLSEKTYDDAMEFYKELLDEYEMLIENR